MAARRIDTVLLDLDGTICEYRRSGDEVLSIAFERTGVEPFFTEDEYLERIESLSIECDTFREFRSECFAAIARDRGLDEQIGRTVATAYADERDQRNVAFLPGAEDALETLATEYPLGLVTNGGPDIQREKLRALGIEESFDTIVYAGYDTPAKPDPSPFLTALGDLDRAPERAVHVGNSLADDVAGARAAGLTAVWLDDGREPEPVPDHIIDSPKQLTRPPW